MSSSSIVAISALGKDGTYTVSTETSSSSSTTINAQKMLLYDKSLFKCVYKGQLAGPDPTVVVSAFLARGIKNCDNMMLLHVASAGSADDAKFIAFRSPPDSSTGAKVLSLDTKRTSSATLQKALPNVRQILQTSDSLLFLERATSIVGAVSSIS